MTKENGDISKMTRQIQDLKKLKAIIEESSKKIDTSKLEPILTECNNTLNNMPKSFLDKRSEDVEAIKTELMDKLKIKGTIPSSYELIFDTLEEEMCYRPTEKLATKSAIMGELNEDILALEG
ncbi:hypothetical protein phytr_1610 [Candidatus Phycorickettsia trachydisci]|uniref:Uncharacterized protein n=1 Tax=Candidatus Phycorickettsia trachydisci TaxID=2115978 RepID=A0A2P1P775_9RICK|nr:hypothetical protein [Candidatus Phycorickettsia trachydisci]AVP87120.1 hypothetical protein phytr_1610 [Candidatus Phycorickettsia trachydisci]